MRDWYSECLTKKTKNDLLGQVKEMGNRRAGLKKKGAKMRGGVYEGED